jgi:hypothetical protein
MKFAQFLVQHSPHLARHILPYIAAYKFYNSVGQRDYQRESEEVLRASGLYSQRVAHDIGMLRMKFFADQMFLEYAKPTDVATMVPAIAEGDANFLAIRQKVAIGRPFLFGCSYFGCMFFVLLALKDLVSDLLIVTAGDPTPSIRLFKKIGQTSGININVVGATEYVVALQILRQLKRGGAVATMLDCFYGTNPCLYTDFLGKPAASLGTLYGLAQRANAIVVPTASIQRGGKQTLDIGELIDLQSTSIEEAGQRVNDYFSNLVRTYPDQWMGWQNLLTRWNMARI